MDYYDKTVDKSDITFEEEDEDRSGDCCAFTVDSNFIQLNYKLLNESSLIEG